MSSEPNWPYQDTVARDPMDPPSWACPDGKCQCSNPERTDEQYEISVMLCAPDGERMAGARCRVLVNGELANADTPNANGDGWITVLVDRVPHTLTVEWAPPDTPIRSDLPYVRRYYVDLKKDDREESARRRLSNLGFHYFPTLRENVQDFQREYGHYPNGNLDEVEVEIGLYHDAALIPITERSTEPAKPPSAGEPGANRNFQLASFTPKAQPGGGGGSGGAKPQAPPGPPPSKGGTNAGQGTIKAPPPPKTIVEVHNSGDFEFKWAKITTSDSGIDATFWVFEDAYKEKSTQRRWPCTAVEAQAVADLISVEPKDLPGWDNPPAQSPEKSLFLTPKLMDVRFEESKAQGGAFDPCTGNINNPMMSENANMSKCVDSHKKTGAIVGDPGKIWALSNKLVTATGATVKVQGQPAACNYGWHILSSVKVAKKPPSKTGFQYSGGDVSPAATNATTGQFVIQAEEIGHFNVYKDYSQILLLCAGWCRIVEPGKSPVAMRTADVYTTLPYAKLANADGTPLRTTRQPENPTAAQIQAQQAVEDTIRAVEKGIREGLIRGMLGL